WQETERRRLLERGYPEALAEFWTRCAREGYAERQLLDSGVLSTGTARRLRYLELPPWREVDRAARILSRGEEEYQILKRLWIRDEQSQQQILRPPDGQAIRPVDAFGPGLKELRKKRGIARRELADLFGIRGKKPARILKYIEEDGF